MFIQTNSVPFQSKNLLHPCENKENIGNRSLVNQSIVTDDEESHGKRGQEDEGLEPLDYRQDWSQEIIDTFLNLQSCFQLDKVIGR